jgi:hypothetical protein
MTSTFFGHGGAGGIDCLGSLTLWSSVVAANHGGSTPGNTVFAGAGGLHVRSLPGLFACSATPDVRVDGATFTGNTGGSAYSSFAAGPGAMLVDSTCAKLDATALIAFGNTGGAGTTGGQAANEILAVAQPLFPAQGSVSVAYSDVAGGFIGAGNIDQDPLFVDVTLGDYHLQPCSPCVDTAAAPSNPPLTAPLIDVDGGPRSTGARPDIGADELDPVVARLVGSCEDLELLSVVNGAGNPFALVKSAAAGSTILTYFHSPAAGFAGAVPVLAAQLFVSSLPPASPSAFPAVHLDLGAIVVFDGFMPGGPFVLGPGGLVRAVTLPGVALAGFTARFQGFALAPFAANGIFAATHAHDFVLR